MKNSFFYCIFKLSNIFKIKNLRLNLTELNTNLSGVEDREDVEKRFV